MEKMIALNGPDYGTQEAMIIVREAPYEMMMILGIDIDRLPIDSVLFSITDRSQVGVLRINVWDMEHFSNCPYHNEIIAHEVGHHMRPNLLRQGLTLPTTAEEWAESARIEVACDKHAIMVCGATRVVKWLEWMYSFFKDQAITTEIQQFQHTEFLTRIEEARKHLPGGVRIEQKIVTEEEIIAQHGEEFMNQLRYREATGMSTTFTSYRFRSIKERIVGILKSLFNSIRGRR